MTREVEYGGYNFEVKDTKPLHDKQNEELKSLCLWSLRRLHKTHKDFGYDQYEKITGEKPERL